MNRDSLRKSGNFVIYINEYASSRPSLGSKASLPDSTAELTLNKKILIQQTYPESIPLTIIQPKQ
jgi:hypothetical protein